MKRLLLSIILFSGLIYSNCDAQKRYGYTVLHFRCGDDDPKKDRVYYSPVIELNTLNFPRYTDGVDPAIAKYSVRYYNYAIAKWFEIYLKDKYNILINAPEKYARKSNSAIYNEKNKADCNADKTNNPCFFMNLEELVQKRKNEIDENRSPQQGSNFCEIIDL